MYLVKPICQQHLQAALNECRDTESNESSEAEEDMVLVGPASGSFGGVPYREQSNARFRPPSS